MNELKSYTEYAVSTPTADFVIGFDFNYGEDAVNVTVDDVPASEAGYTVVYLNETTIRLSPSVPSGVVRLQRETDIDQTDHAYRAGAKFIAQTMDENFEQLRHSQQEVRDGFSKLADDTYTLIDGLDAAIGLAQDAASDAQVAAVIAQDAADTVNTIIVEGKVGAANVLDASGKTQQEVNDEQKEVKDRIVYIQDFGGAYTDFDPSTAESEAKAIANQNSKPYDGARQFVFPMRTLKVWNYLDGYKDRGAVVSFSNVDSFDAPEPVTQVLGVSNPRGLIEYKDRDVVGIYNAVGAQKALLKSTNTTFSATSVTCPDFVISDLRKDQIIDVVDGAEKYSSIVESVSGNTVTIVDGWYKHSVLGDKGTPTNGSQLILVPNTKVWGQNTNVFISEDSDVHSFAGFEMGIFNYKADGMGYGYDVWNGGSKQTGQGYQTRGQFNVGFYAFEGTQIGFVAKDSVQIGFYANGGVEGFQSQNSNYGFTAKSSLNYSFRVLDSNNVFLSGVTSNGAQERFKLTQTSETGNTISNFSVVSIFNAPSNNFVVNLPNPSENYQRVIYVKNINASNAILLAGSVEGGTGSLPLPTRSTLQLFCDGSAWYPISKHSFA